MDPQIVKLIRKPQTRSPIYRNSHVVSEQVLKEVEMPEVQMGNLAAGLATTLRELIWGRQGWPFQKYQRQYQNCFYAIQQFLN